MREREWYVIFADDPSREPVPVKSGSLPAPDYGGFVDAAAAGTYEGRPLAGMYIIEPLGEQGEAIVWCGSIPPWERIGRHSERTAMLDLKGYTPRPKKKGPAEAGPE